MKISVLIFLWSTFILSSSVSAEELSCAYEDKFNQCIVANQNGTARSIEDFICRETSDRNQILDQIILDTEFKKYDTEILSFIDSLKADKEASVLDPNRIIDDIMKNLAREGYYHKKYKAICNGGLVAKRFSCTEEIPNTIGVNYLNGGNFDGRSCISLANTKVDIHRQVAYDIIKRNKSEVFLDQKQVFQQTERSYYGILLDLKRFITWAIERLASVSHWTQKPL